MPDIQNKLTKKLFSFATSSMDISDGLIVDLNKLINTIRFLASFFLYNTGNNSLYYSKTIVDRSNSSQSFDDALKEHFQ